MSRRKSDISPEQIQYYSRIEGVMESDDTFESDEDRTIFARNVFRQVLDDGILQVFSNKQTSKTIETVLQSLQLPSPVSQELTQAICEHFSALSQDKCASHVVQTWLICVLIPACLHEWQREAQTTETQPGPANESMGLLCKTVKSNLESFICDQYASHVIRSLLQVLSGVTLCEQVNRSRYSREYRKSMIHKGVEYCKGRQLGIIQDIKPTSQLFVKLLKSLSRATLKLDQFSKLLTQCNACPVLQTLLVALIEKLPKRGLKLSQKIVEIAAIKSQPGDDSVIPTLFVNPVSSHLMDVLIGVCSSEVHQNIYDTCFRHHIMEYALHPIANYALQQLMCTSEIAQVAMILDELDLEKVLFCGHMGVVVKATEACKRCPPKQQVILLNKLLTAFHTESHSQDCAILFTSLVTRDIYFKPDSEPQVPEKAECSLHGSLIMQSLLQYDNTQLIANSFLTIPTDQLLAISCDLSGSHVVDVFLSSKSVALKKKTKLIKKFIGHFVQLSKQKQGSRVVDSCWKYSELKDKQLIADELMKGEKELSDNYYGKFVLRNCNIDYYKRKGDLREGIYNSKEKVKKMFSDIVDKPCTQQGATRKRKSRKELDHDVGLVVKKKKLFEDDSD